jgi:quinol monooxygenase YgiN
VSPGPGGQALVNSASARAEHVDMFYDRGWGPTSSVSKSVIGGEMTDGVRIEATRRGALRTMGGASLAVLGLGGLAGRVAAQQATPVAAGDLEGTYAVARVRKVKPEYSATDVSRSVAEGFAPVVREVPGYVSYFVIADDERHTWVSVGIFTDKAGADESTERAKAFGQQGTDDMIDGDPIIIEGPIDTFAS